CLWHDRPQSPLAPVMLRDAKLAGEHATDKLKKIQAELMKLRADALVVSDLQNIAWAFNIRGSDIAHTPLVLASALILREGRPLLYIDHAKIGNEVRHALEGFVDIRAPQHFTKDLATLKGKTVRLDQTSSTQALNHLVSERVVSEHGGKP